MKIEDLVMCDGKLFIDYLKDNALDAGVKMDEWTEGYEACKSRLAKILIPQIKANAIPDTHCIVPKGQANGLPDEGIKHLIGRLERVILLIRSPSRESGHMAIAALLADISALKAMIAASQNDN